MPHFDFPEALALVPVALAVVLVWAKGRPLAATALRAAALSLFSASLAAPAIELTAKRSRHVAFLLDVSDSIPIGALERAMEFIERESDGLARSGDSSSLVLFAGSSDVVRARDVRPILFDPRLKSLVLHRRPRRGNEEEDRVFRDWRRRIDPGFTRFVGALQAARFEARSDEARSLVLMTDGKGEDLPEASFDSVTLVPLTTEPPHASMIRAQAPLSSRVGEPFDLRLDIRSDSVARGTLRVSVDGAPRPDLERALSLRPGTNEVAVPFTPPPTAGLRRIEAFIEVPGDPERANKRAAALVHVLGRPRILLLGEGARPDRGLGPLLALQRADVVARDPSNLAGLVPELNSFDAVIVQGPPPATVTELGWRALGRYVADAGGGLLFLGEPSSRAMPLPLESLLPVTFEPPSQSPGEENPEGPPPAVRVETKRVLAPRVSLIILVDKSGSMAGTNIKLSKEACLAAVRALSEQDMVGIIGFDVRPRWVVEPTSPAHYERIEDQVLRLYAVGGTDIYPAMEMAEAVLKSARTPIRHVLLLSDGDNNYPRNFEALADRMAAEGITVSTITLLDGDFDLAVMKGIAEHGRGRYLWASDPRNLPQIFVSEVRQVLGDAPDGVRTPALPDSSPRKEPAREPRSPTSKAMDHVPFRPVARGVHESIQGIDFSDAPELLGMMKSKAKESSLVPLVDSREGRPLLAFWRLGLGKAAVWSSDFGSDWSEKFAHWPKAGKLMAQVVRSVMSNLKSSSLYSKLRAQIREREADLILDAPGAEARLVAPESHPLGLTREEGRLVIRVPLEEPGQLYQVAIQSGPEVAHVGIAAPPPRELLDIGLERKLFAPGARAPNFLELPEVVERIVREDLAPWAMAAGLALLAAGLLAQRLLP